MPDIRCNAPVFKLDTWTIVRLPQHASAGLPSRGMTMVQGTVDGTAFQAALEPDGRGSHWFRVDTLLPAGTLKDVATVELVLDPLKDWPEPEIPADIASALLTDTAAHDLWTKLTPMARWDWLRWIRATNRQETRQHRIEVALSKLKHGERRPCCFNRTMCTEPAVSKNGMLLIPGS